MEKLKSMRMDKKSEFCLLHNLCIPNAFSNHDLFTKPPGHHQHLIKQLKTRNQQRNPYPNQVDYVIIINSINMKIYDACSCTNATAISEQFQ